MRGVDKFLFFAQPTRVCLALLVSFRSNTSELLHIGGNLIKFRADAISVVSVFPGFFPASTLSTVRQRRIASKCGIVVARRVTAAAGNFRAGVVGWTGARLDADRSPSTSEQIPSPTKVFLTRPVLVAQFRNSCPADEAVFRNGCARRRFAVVAVGRTFTEKHSAGTKLTWTGVYPRSKNWVATYFDASQRICVVTVSQAFECNALCNELVLHTATQQVSNFTETQCCRSLPNTSLKRSFVSARC